MAPISASMADQVAQHVFRQATNVLDHAHEEGWLSAFAYSANSLERWWVAETYARVFNAWDRIVPAPERSTWDAWMEGRLPGDESRHVDLFVGPHEEGNNGLHRPTLTAPVFEFKVLRDDDWNDKVSGDHGVLADAKKVGSAGLVNAFAFLLFRLEDEKYDLPWYVDDLARRSKDRLITPREAQFDTWGPTTCQLQRYGKGRVRFYAQAYRFRA